MDLLFQITQLIFVFILVYALYVFYTISRSRFRSVILFIALLQFISGTVQLVELVRTYL